MSKKKKRIIPLIKRTVIFFLTIYRLDLFEKKNSELVLKEKLITDSSFQINSIGREILFKLEKVPPALKTFILEKAKRILSGDKATLCYKERKKWPDFKHEKKQKEEEPEPEKAKKESNKSKKKESKKGKKKGAGHDKKEKE